MIIIRPSDTTYSVGMDRTTGPDTTCCAVAVLARPGAALAATGASQRPARTLTAGRALSGRRRQCVASETTAPCGSSRGGLFVFGGRDREPQQGAQGHHAHKMSASLSPRPGGRSVQMQYSMRGGESRSSRRPTDGSLTPRSVFLSPLGKSASPRSVGAS